MASESHTTDVAVVQRRDERRRRERAVGRVVARPRSWTSTSGTARPESFVASQPRSDHDE